MIKKINYKNDVYIDVKQHILNGHYPPGHKLNERALGDSYGLSRTPVREALNLLEQEGWINIIPHKGAFVSKIDDTFIKEIIDIRVILEPAIIDLLYNKINSSRIKELDTILRLTCKVDPKDGDDFIKLDRLFHLKLVEWTDNQNLIELFKSLNDKIYLVGRIALSSEDYTRSISTLKEHTDIVTALKAKNFSLAKSFMTTHMLETRRRIYQYLLSKKDGEPFLK
ncbi:GntR family transcriptional regulator [Veillonella magna]|uniref:GntR family transcriptional regulator n=1 Tax=Veillonella magna TaxID=464322 RepID=UPI0023F19953|nr:GntR family transcriptional regulator [Veillonella magna]